MFVYCNNNPVLYADPAGYMVQACPLCGPPIPCEDLIYETEYNSIGKLYEYWNDPKTGKHIWSRHHTTHGNAKKHTDPHDHEWKDDDDGNNKPGPPQPPNPNYTAPSNDTNRSNKSNQMIGEITTVAVISAMAYWGIKWIIAAALAPVTTGGSLVVAGLMP